MRFRFRLPTFIAAAVLIPLGLSGAVAAAHPAARQSNGEPAALTAAQVRLLAAHATDRSIIIFKNQLTNLPARGATLAARVSAAKAAQAPIIAELTEVHATNVQGFQIINAIAATISPAEVARLQANPAIAAVEPDVLQHLTSRSGASTSGTEAPDAAATSAVASGDTSDQRTCPRNPAKPLIEPESRGLMNVNAANKIVDGTGIKVGVIFGGVDVNNPDLVRKDGQSVIFDNQDFSGQGPNTASSGLSMGYVGLIAAQGNQVYDLSNYVNPAHPLPAGCNIKIVGVAPGASVAEANFGDDFANQIYNAQIIQAIQYEVMTDHVNVLVEPFGGTAFPNFMNDPSALADQAAIAAGVVVVGPTGDTGTTSSGNIFSPGGVPGVIGVGASTALRSYRQTDANGPNAGRPAG